MTQKTEGEQVDKNLEEWIEKKANQLNAIILKSKYISYTSKIKQIKDFVRSIVQEIQKNQI